MIIRHLGHATNHLFAGSTSLVTDPWLTHRLDRLWVHLAGPVVDSVPDIDVVLLTHHHIDHFHVPSLEHLTRESVVVFPRLHPEHRAVDSGMGHIAAGWVLRHLGFHNLRPVDPFERVRVAGIEITALPSAVGFPEVAYVVESDDASALFAGDCKLHPALMSWMAEDHRPVDVAFLPTHSVAPSEPLLRRTPVINGHEYRREAAHNLRRWTETVQAQTVVPSSFGWCVEDPGADDGRRWLNRVLFPLSPPVAARMLANEGHDARALGPGAVLEVGPGRSEVVAHGFTPDELMHLYDCVAFEPDTAVPPFDPKHDTVGVQTRSVEVLVGELVASHRGSEAWAQAAEGALDRTIRVSGHDDDRIWRINAVTGHAVPVDDHAAAWTWIAAPTLEALLDANLSIGSSYGLWVGADRLLSEVFHQLEYVIRGLEKVQAAVVQ